MSSAEKQAVFGRIMQKTKSPWTVYSFGTWVQKHRWVSALAVFIIVVVAGNSAVLASQESLPGDTFYPIKVNIVEPIRVALATNTLAKAEIQTQLIQNRLQESETLAARGKLDTKKEQNLNERIEKQVSDLAVSINKVKDASPKVAEDISTTLEASINTHDKILDVIAINRGENRSKRTKDVSVTSKMVNPELNDEKEKNKDNEYLKKKESVKSLIKKTTIDVASSTMATSSILQETIMDNAQANLDHAKEKLREAEDHDKNGDADEAYSALIDSERSTKEAALFIKAKERLEKESKKEDKKGH